MIDLPFIFWGNLKEIEEIFEVKFLRTYAHSQFAAVWSLKFIQNFMLRLINDHNLDINVDAKLKFLGLTKH